MASRLFVTLSLSKHQTHIHKTLVGHNPYKSYPQNNPSS